MGPLMSSIRSIRNQREGTAQSFRDHYPLQGKVHAESAAAVKQPMIGANRHGSGLSVQKPCTNGDNEGNSAGNMNKRPLPNKHSDEQSVTPPRKRQRDNEKGCILVGSSNNGGHSSQQLEPKINGTTAGIGPRVHSADRNSSIVHQAPQHLPLTSTSDRDFGPKQGVGDTKNLQVTPNCPSSSAHKSPSEMNNDDTKDKVRAKNIARKPNPLLPNRKVEAKPIHKLGIPMSWLKPKARPLKKVPPQSKVVFDPTKSKIATKNERSANVKISLKTDRSSLIAEVTKKAALSLVTDSSEGSSIVSYRNMQVVSSANHNKKHQTGSSVPAAIVTKKSNGVVQELKEKRKIKRKNAEMKQDEWNSDTESEPESESDSSDSEDSQSETDADQALDRVLN